VQYEPSIASRKELKPPGSLCFHAAYLLSGSLGMNDGCDTVTLPTSSLVGIGEDTPDKPSQN
jgi:hypothetical protein